LPKLPRSRLDALHLYLFARKHLQLPPKNITVMASKADFKFITGEQSFGSHFWDEQHISQVACNRWALRPQRDEEM
jgi:hypothetical protein